MDYIICHSKEKLSLDQLAEVIIGVNCNFISDINRTKKDFILDGFYYGIGKNDISEKDRNFIEKYGLEIIGGL